MVGGWTGGGEFIIGCVIYEMRLFKQVTVRSRCRSLHSILDPPLLG